jgi:hypothetical protein
MLKALGERLSIMFGIFFAALIAMALLSICGEIAMRVRLTRREASGDKLAWWRRGGDEVAATYGQLFPSSYLPLLRRFVFWLFITCSLGVLLELLLKSK